MKRIKNPKQTREKEKYTKSITYTSPSLPLVLAKGNYYSLFKTLIKKEKVMPMSPYMLIFSYALKRSCYIHWSLLCPFHLFIP